MKKLVLILALSLLLGACTAQDVATNISTSTQTAKDKVASVQSYATQLCRFIPTAGTVISIFNSGFANDVATVANAICNAVTTNPLADGPGDRLPRVNGIVVKGKRV